ncbi:unnamed protein product [Auanema sp. JU1783]|nr:unnamed protein product [Auanema sp. JU1783]
MDRDEHNLPQSSRTENSQQLGVDTNTEWLMDGQPSPRRVVTAPTSPSTAYTTDREAVFRSGSATVAETHLIRSSGSQSQSFTEEHWSSEITSFIAAAPPKFIQVIKAYRVLSSDTPTLVVEVASDPPAIFEWFCNDKPVQQDRRKFQVRHGLNITTLTVTQPDQGVYKCTARNPAGCSTSYGYITVNFEHRYEDWSVSSDQTEVKKERSSSITHNLAPRFINQVPNLTVPPGQEAVIDVVCDANPPARFAWFVNGKEFKENTNVVDIFYPEENRCVARFHIPTSGEYKVVASNVHGTAMSSGFIEIYQANPTKQMRPPLAPGEQLARTVMTSSQQAGQTTTGEHTTSTHQSTSVYEVNYTQRSSSVPRGVRHLERHFEISKSPERTLSNLHRSDASTATTQRIPRSMHKTRSEGGKYLPHPPKFLTKLPETITVRPDEKLVLSVDVSSIPTADFKWDVNGFEVKQSKNVTLLNEQNRSTLVVNPPVKQGKYNVIATNDVGRDALLTRVTHIVTETVEEIHSDIRISTPSPLPVGPEVVESAVTVTSAPESDWELIDDNHSNNSTTSFETVLKRQEIIAVKTEETLITTEEDVVVDKSLEQAEQPIVDQTSVNTSYTKRVIRTGRPDAVPRKPTLSKPTIQKIHVNRGEKLILESKVDSDPSSKFEWYVNNFEVKSGQFIIIENVDENHSRATFLKPIAGNYKVIARNEFGQLESVTKVTTEVVEEEFMEKSTVTTTITKHPEQPSNMYKLVRKPQHEKAGLPKAPAFLQQLPAILRINDGEDLRLKGVVSAIPPASFLWRLNNFEIKTGPNTQILLEQENSTELFLKHAGPGRYEIMATNQLGQASSQCKVIVEYEDVHQQKVNNPPVFIQALPTETIVASDETRVVVTVSGVPPINFKWLVDGIPIENDNRITSVIEGNRAILILKKPLENNSLIEVIASNSFGETTAQTKTITQDRQPEQTLKPVEDRAPVFAKELVDMELLENCPLVCGVGVEKISDACTFYWTLDNQPIDPSTGYVVDSTTHESILTIERIPVTVSGALSAVAQNEFGTAVTTAELSVQKTEEPFEMVAPDIPEECAPKILEPLHSASFMDGQPMVLRCKIHASPSAIIVWSKDDVNVEEWVINKDVFTQILPGGICELVNPECYEEDSGVYKCHASNPHGTAETSAYIAVEGATYHKDREEASMSESMSSAMVDEFVADGEKIILPPKFVESLTAETDAIQNLNYIRIVGKVTSGSNYTVTWLKEEAPLAESEKYEIYQFDDGSQILTIHSPGQADEGVYTCKVESEHGLSSSSCEVRLPSEIDKLEDLEMPSTSPSPEETQADIVLDDTVLVELTIPQEVPSLKADDRIDRITEITKNEEEFKLLVKVADTVASTLVANIIVSAVREAARIIADESSEDEEDKLAAEQNSAPRFDTLVEEYVATEGGAIRISTTVGGYPTPFVEWKFNGQKINITEKLSMSYEKGIASLNMKDLQLDSGGTYYCHATNMHGTKILETRLKVLPKASDMNIRFSLANYDKQEANEKVITNVFAHNTEDNTEQNIKILEKRRDSQSALIVVPTKEKEQDESIKADESADSYETARQDETQSQALPLDIAAQQVQEQSTSSVPMDSIESNENKAIEIVIAPPESGSLAVQDVGKPQLPEEIVAQEIVSNVIQELNEDVLKKAASPLTSNENEMKTTPTEQLVVEQPDSIIEEEKPVEQPVTKEQKVESFDATTLEIVEKPVNVIDKDVQAAAEKFAQSFTESVMNQAAVVLTAPSQEEKISTEISKSIIHLSKDAEEERKSETMRYDEKLKVIENRLRCASSPDLTAEEAVNMVMNTVLSLKEQHQADTLITVDVRNPDTEFSHVVTVYEPLALQLSHRLNATTNELKFIDLETILQKPGTSSETTHVVETLSSKRALAEHRIVVLEGVSKNFQDAMTWSLRKVKRLVDEEESTNANIEVVQPQDEATQGTTVVIPEQIIPDLLQVAAAASKLKLENVTVSLVKQGDASHQELIIEYESQLEDEANLAVSQLNRSRQTSETREEKWSRPTRYSDENDLNVVAVFVEVDATCPDQSVEIVASVNMPLDSIPDGDSPGNPQVVDVREPSDSATESSSTGLQPPKFFRKLEDCKAVVGNPVQFKCIVCGTPTPEILWTVDGDVIEANQEYTIVFEDGVSILRINEVLSEDEGEYCCIATNNAGSSTTKCFLKVFNEQEDANSCEIFANRYLENDNDALFEEVQQKAVPIEHPNTTAPSAFLLETVEKPVAALRTTAKFNEDLKEMSSFYKYPESGEIAVKVTELIQESQVQGDFQVPRSKIPPVPPPKPKLRRDDSNSLISTSSTNLFLQNSNENSFSSNINLLEKHITAESASFHTAVSMTESAQFNKDFEDPFTDERIKLEELGTSPPENQLYEPRTPLLPQKIRYKGQDIGVFVNEIESNDNENQSKKILETSLEFNTSLHTKKVVLPHDEHTNVSLNGPAEAKIAEIKIAEAKIAEAKIAEAKIAEAEVEEPKIEEPKESLKDKNLMSRSESKSESSGSGTSSQRKPHVPGGGRSEKEKTDTMTNEQKQNYKDKMREIEKIARQVEQQLSELNVRPRVSNSSELSDDAKEIEEAILRMSEQLVYHSPITEAQAEASEELMRTTLADMILNPNQHRSEEAELMKTPIRILKRKISDIENSLMEDVELCGINETTEITTTSPSGTATTVVKVPIKTKRVPSAELIRMTPLTTDIREQLTTLEDMINEHINSESTSSVIPVDPTKTPAEVRQELHDIFVQINNEISVIRGYCKKKLTKKGADAVMQVLEKVKIHVTSIVNIMALSKRRCKKMEKKMEKRLEAAAPPETGKTTTVKAGSKAVPVVEVTLPKEPASTNIQFMFTKPDNTESIEGILIFKQSSMDRSSNIQTSAAGDVGTKSKISTPSVGKIEEEIVETPVAPPRRKRDTSRTPRKEEQPVERKALEEAKKISEASLDDLHSHVSLRSMTLPNYGRTKQKTRDPVAPPRRRKDHSHDVNLEKSNDEPRLMTHRHTSLDSRDMDRELSGMSSSQKVSTTKAFKQFTNALGKLKNFNFPNPLKKKNKNRELDRELLIPSSDFTQEQKDSSEPLTTDDQSQDSPLDDNQELRGEFTFNAANTSTRIHPLERPSDPLVYELEHQSEASNLNRASPHEEVIYHDVFLEKPEESDLAIQLYTGGYSDLSQFETPILERGGTPEYSDLEDEENDRTEAELLEQLRSMSGDPPVEDMNTANIDCSAYIVKSQHDEAHQLDDQPVLQSCVDPETQLEIPPDVQSKVSKEEFMENPQTQKTWSEDQTQVHISMASMEYGNACTTEMSTESEMPMCHHMNVDCYIPADDTNSVQMLCEESDYATDTDTSCMLKGTIQFFNRYSTSSDFRFPSNMSLNSLKPLKENLAELEQKTEDIEVNIELRSVDPDEMAMDCNQSEAQFSVNDYVLEESDLDSRSEDRLPPPPTKVGSNLSTIMERSIEDSTKTRSEEADLNPTEPISEETIHFVVDEAQLSQMASSLKTEDYDRPLSSANTMRETDILSDESIVTEIEQAIIDYVENDFEFSQIPAKRGLIATVSQDVRQRISANVAADNSFDIEITQEPEIMGLTIKVIEDQIDFTSLTILANFENTDCSEHLAIMKEFEDFTETSSFDEYEGEDSKTGITVSIIARSLHDGIYASLEEIPWGEAQITLKEFEMTRSCDNSLHFNVTVSEATADEKKSLRSQASFKESQNSISEIENTLSSGSINIPSYVIKLGSTATITCELNNYLPPNSIIDWYKGKEPLRRTAGKFDRISHDLLEVLIINVVEMDDNDLYSLKVNNDIFPVAFLVIEDPEALSVFLTPPQTQFVMDGQPTELAVQVSESSDCQQITWLRDRKPLKVNKSGRSIVCSPDGWNRLLLEKTSLADQGTYYAVLGEQHVTITLVVEERIDEKELTVMASGTESEDDDVQEYLVPPGSTATIACELEENDCERELLWLKDGHPISFENISKSEHVINGLKHYLVIHDTCNSDSGLYSVSISSVVFRVAHLIVNDLATSNQGLRRKRISNSSLYK